MMERGLWGRAALVLSLMLISGGAARPPAQQAPGDQAGSHVIALTEAALLEQIRCQRDPQVERAIDAMRANHLLRYVDNESGIYLFAATKPLTFLGLPITHISGFDADSEFLNTPGSTMVGTAPPVFLEIDVAAPASELRARALKAGLVEAIPHQHKRGFEVSAGRSYLAPKSKGAASNIQCNVYPPSWPQG
jgi:hypothetical protein